MTPEVFWKVKDVQVTKFERPLRKHGIFDVKFVCSPFEYFVEGQSFKTLKRFYSTLAAYQSLVQNLRRRYLYPYRKRENMKANIGQNLTINTELMLAYREDGTMMNSSVTGEYKDLYLKSGENAISVSPGFSITVKPNWRYF